MGGNGKGKGKGNGKSSGRTAGEARAPPSETPSDEDVDRDAGTAETVRRLERLMKKPYGDNPTTRRLLGELKMNAVRQACSTPSLKGGGGGGWTTSPPDGTPARRPWSASPGSSRSQKTPVVSASKAGSVAASSKSDADPARVKMKTVLKTYTPSSWREERAAWRQPTRRRPADRPRSALPFRPSKAQDWVIDATGEGEDEGEEEEREEEGWVVDATGEGKEEYEEQDENALETTARPEQQSGVGPSSDREGIAGNAGVSPRGDEDESQGGGERRVTPVALGTAGSGLSAEASREFARSRGDGLGRPPRPTSEKQSTVARPSLEKEHATVERAEPRREQLPAQPPPEQQARVCPALSDDIVASAESIKCRIMLEHLAPDLLRIQSETAGLALMQGKLRVRKDTAAGAHLRGAAGARRLLSALHAKCIEDPEALVGVRAALEGVGGPRERGLVVAGMDAAGAGEFADFLAEELLDLSVATSDVDTTQQLMQGLSYSLEGGLVAARENVYGRGVMESSCRHDASETSFQLGTSSLMNDRSVLGPLSEVEESAEEGEGADKDGGNDEGTEQEEDVGALLQVSPIGEGSGIRDAREPLDAFNDDDDEYGDESGMAGNHVRVKPSHLRDPSIIDPDYFDDDF